MCRLFIQVTQYKLHYIKTKGDYCIIYNKYIDIGYYSFGNFVYDMEKKKKTDIKMYIQYTAYNMHYYIVTYTLSIHLYI